MQFSIIIPAYNVAPYIECCIRSVCEQDFDKNLFEVICVDDCSTDHTLNILEDLSREYTNLVVLKHDVNKHQGGGRNTGLRVAKGDYILFLDADDCFIYNNVLSIFHQLLQIKAVDILRANGHSGISVEYDAKPIPFVGKLSIVSYYTSESYFATLDFSNAVWGGRINEKCF